MTELTAAQVAVAVREACARAAADAYEDAGIRGLCEEGRWEVALDAIRRLDLSAVLAARHGSGEGGSSAA